LLVRAIALPRLRVGEQLRQIDTYGFGPPAGEAELAMERSSDGKLNELAERVGRFAAAHVDTVKPLPRKSLLAAGYYSLSPEAFHGYRVLAAMSIPALVVLNAIASSKPAVTAIALAMVT